MHSVNDDPNSHIVKIRKYLLTNSNTSQLLNLESGVRDLRSDKGEFYVREDGIASPETSFVVGRVDNVHENVMGLNRPNCNKNKSKGTLKNKTGLSPSKPTLAIGRSPRKGILLSVQDGAREQKGAMQLDKENVAKRKHEHACTLYDESIEIKKKIRMEEETRQLNALLAEHLESAKAIGQPR